MKSDKALKFYTYMILTKNNTYYCGYTNDIQARYQKHLEGVASKYTRAFKPEKLVFIKEFATKSEAMKEECRIKKLTRKQKDALIQGVKND